jgi:hypothetical protein
VCDPGADGDRTRDAGNRGVRYAKKHEFGVVVYESMTAFGEPSGECGPDTTVTDDVDGLKHL